MSGILRRDKPGTSTARTPPPSPLFNLPRLSPLSPILRSGTRRAIEQFIESSNSDNESYVSVSAQDQGHVSPTPIQPTPRRSKAKRPTEGDYGFCWRMYERHKCEGFTNAVCRECRKEYKYSGGSSTLTRHFTKNHGVRYVELLEQYNQEQGIEAGKGSKFPPEKMPLVAAACADWICLNGRPTYITEDSGLAKLARSKLLMNCFFF